jgi:hypothetical protein
VTPLSAAATRQRAEITAGLLRDLSREGWNSAAPSSDLEGMRLWRGQAEPGLAVRVSEYWAEFALDVGREHLARPDEAVVLDDVTYLRALGASLQCFLCKYALDINGDLSLRAELPAEALDREDIAGAAGALLAAARAAFPNILFDNCTRLTKPKLDPDEPEVLSEAKLFALFKMLDDKGWVFKERLAPNHWRAAQIGRERHFDVFLSFNHSWAYFQVPMLVSPRPPASPPAAAEGLLFTYALRMNDQMQWAKLGIDEDGQVVLAVEMPLSMFDFRRFRAAARTIERYAAEIFYEVQMLAELDYDKALLGLLMGARGRSSTAALRGKGQHG